MVYHLSHAAPEGLRIYTIGDIHGRLDLLESLLDLIRADLEADPPASACRMVCLGDLVDRGPDPAGVLAAFAAPPPDLPEAVTLRGNHEAMMLAFLDHPDAGDLWLRNGGNATVHSYGLDCPLSPDPPAWHALREALLAAIPASHLAFLRALPLSHREGGLFFAHAGVDPATPLAEQREEDLLWIREPFLSWNNWLPMTVIHGHTPRPYPEIRRHRMGLDTGAILTGRLTAARIEGTAVTFLAAEDPGRLSWG